MLSEFFEPFGLIMGDEGVDDLIESTFQDLFEPVEREAYPVIRHPVLGVIVGPDALTPVSAADLGLALTGYIGIPILNSFIEQSGPKDFQGFILVF